MKTIICELACNIQTLNRNAYAVRTCFNTEEKLEEGEIFQGLFKATDGGSPYNYMKVVKILDKPYIYENNGVLSDTITCVNFKEIGQFKTGVVNDVNTSFGSKV